MERVPVGDGPVRVDRDTGRYVVSAPRFFRNPGTI